MLKTQVLKTNNIVSQVEGNIVSNMGKEKIMLSIKNGKYYNIGEVGGEIWERIRNPISISNLINELMIIFDVEKHLCEEHVLGFLNILAVEKLINVE